MSIVSPVPRDQIRILLPEGIAETAVNALTAAGYCNIEQRTGALEEKQNPSG